MPTVLEDLQALQQDQDLINWNNDSNLVDGPTVKNFFDRYNDIIARLINEYTPPDLPEASTTQAGIIQIAQTNTDVSDNSLAITMLVLMSVINATLEEAPPAGGLTARNVRDIIAFALQDTESITKAYDAEDGVLELNVKQGYVYLTLKDILQDSDQIQADFDDEARTITLSLLDNVVPPDINIFYETDLEPINTDKVTKIKFLGSGVTVTQSEPGQLEVEITGGSGGSGDEPYLFDPVADLTALLALDVTDSVAFPDKGIIYVEGSKRYFALDREGVDTPDSVDIFPANPSGNWVASAGVNFASQAETEQAVTDIGSVSTTAPSNKSLSPLRLWNGLRKFIDQINTWTAKQLFSVGIGGSIWAGSGNRLAQFNNVGDLERSTIDPALLIVPYTYSTAYVHPNGNNATAIVGRTDKPFATIQAALNAVAVKGSVYVCVGTYTENLSFPSFIGNHGGNVEPFFLNFICEDGVVINGNHTFPSGANNGLLLKIYGRGEFNSTGQLFTGVTGSGNAIRIYGAKDITTSGTVGALFYNMYIDIIENVDRIIASGNIPIFAFINNTPTYPASLPKWINNVKFISSPYALWEGSSGSRPCLDLMNVKRVEVPYMVFNASASGACNYYPNEIERCHLKVSVSFGDAFLGRVQGIFNSILESTHPTNPPIALPRGAGVTDGTGYYYLRLNNVRIKTGGSGVQAITSSDAKPMDYSYTKTNGLLTDTFAAANNDGVFNVYGLNANLI